MLNTKAMLASFCLLLGTEQEVREVEVPEVVFNQWARL